MTASLHAPSSHPLPLAPWHSCVPGLRAPPFRLALRLVLLFSLVLLSACSTRLIYNKSDYFTYLWLDKHLDFQGEQVALTKSGLKEMKEWHRRQQLPQYAQWLKKMEEIAVRDVSADEVCNLSYQVRDSYRELLQELTPHAVKVVERFSPAQLQQLRTRYDKNNQDWQEQWRQGNDAEQRKKRLKRSIDWLEDFYGDLGERQKVALATWLDGAQFDVDLIYAERLRRQDDAIQTFTTISQRGPGASDNSALLDGWFQRLQISPNETYHRYGQALWRRNCEGLAQFHNNTSAQQRTHFAAELGSYRKAFESLMKD